MEWCERVIERATTPGEDAGTGGGEDGKTGETGETAGETAGETQETEGGGGDGGDGEVGGGRLYKHSSSGYEDTGGDSPYSGGSAADATFAGWDGVRTSSVEKLDKEEEQASRALHHVKLLDSNGVTDGSGAAGGGGGVKGLMVHIGERINDRGRPLSAPMRLKLSPATSAIKPGATHRKSISQNNVQGSTHNGGGDPHLLYPRTAASVTIAAPDEELERGYGILAEQYALVSLHRFFHIHADDMDLYNASG